MDDFQRDPALQGTLDRLVNHPHASPADALENFEIVESFRYELGRIRAGRAQGRCDRFVRHLSADLLDDHQRWKYRANHRRMLWISLSVVFDARGVTAAEFQHELVGKFFERMAFDGLGGVHRCRIHRCCSGWPAGGCPAGGWFEG